MIFTKFSCQVNHTDYGIEGGAGRTYLSGTAIDKSFRAEKFGFTGGIFYQVNAPKLISLRAALAYEMKGSAATYSLTDQSGQLIRKVKLRQNFSYITLSCLLRASFGKRVRFFVNAGPYAALLVTQPKGNVIYYQEKYKQTDYGISGGLGCSFPFGRKTALGLELRHSAGLRNIAPVASYLNGKTIKTNSTNLIVSLTRKIGFRN